MRLGVTIVLTALFIFAVILFLEDTSRLHEHTKSQSPTVYNQDTGTTSASENRDICRGETPREFISWGKVARVLEAGKIKAIVQTEDLVVRMKMEDGGCFITREPHIDAIVPLIEECGSACAEVKLVSR